MEYSKKIMEYSTWPCFSLRNTLFWREIRPFWALFRLFFLDLALIWVDLGGIPFEAALFKVVLRYLGRLLGHVFESNAKSSLNIVIFSYFTNPKKKLN